MAESAVAATPTQSAPATQAPPPAGTVESASPTSQDAFPGLSADLDEMIGKSGLGTQENEDRVTNKGRKGREKPAEKPAEKAIAQPPEKPKEGEKPADAPKQDEPKKEGEDTKSIEAEIVAKHTAKSGEKPLGPWQRTHAAERKVKELESKLEEFSKRKPSDDPEKIEFKTKWEKAEEQRKALDDEMRYVNYERSSEFQEKYHKPYVTTWERAIGQVKDLKIANTDGTSRNATPEDLARIVQIPGNEEALIAAEELFTSPTKAAFVIGLRNQLREAHHIMEAAKADFRAKGEERQKAWESEQKTQQEAATKQQEHYRAIWQQGNEAALEQHKDWFVAAEGDEEGKELLAKGFELADLAWNGSDKLEPEKLVALRSAERNKAAGFRYMVHLKAKADARIAELEKQLKDYQDSEPGTGEVANGEKKSEGYDIDAAIARIPTV